ncbi:glyceraldehyde-3-phosphate dehydrogenase [Microcella daejeonensis]|uniref:Glyceraldehyde-3-phosphate dehydrogenase n=1 Tax=Microcella daejeonensis TaxID=2994971 RepID=A0A9E8MKZ2_9MICO|nr:glyceraldehyde-3-phosphate dehydrogenase [Microcella daejeonensis]WAB81404.1 glyceraldehyde-3-phosphate dehydrogenase [Microcella daejeonensis]
MDDAVLDHARQWNAREMLAEQLIPVIGRLYREHGVVTSIHGRRLINQSAIGVIKAHRYAEHVTGAALPMTRTREVLDALLELAPGPASLDIARLISGFEERGADRTLERFLEDELEPVRRDPGARPAGTDVVLYGFGRIGRLLARILIAHAGGGGGLRLRAIVVRRGGADDLVKRASLLRRDSVHGPFDGTISVDEEASAIIANGTVIRVIYADDPAAIDYTEHGIRDAIVVDNTGRWRDEAGLSQHLRSPGVARVLLTAPGKGAIPNIVHGINEHAIGDDDRIVSAASCTTNAVTPVLKVLHDAWGIRHGHVETVHSYTNDQNLIDNFHSGDRRGRSAALNMVITETGAAKAVAKALPALEGRLTGNAIRVPTPDVSMAILNVALERETTRDEVNEHLRQMSLHSDLRQQIDYIASPEVVSTDFIGSHRAGIVDGLATICTGANLIVYVWYDNEYGYSSQVIRVLETMSGSHPRVVPARPSADGGMSAAGALRSEPAPLSPAGAVR